MRTTRIDKQAGIKKQAVTAALAAAAFFLLQGGASPALAALPEPWQLGFQPSASPHMTQITDFHNLLLYITTGVSVFVLGLLTYILVRFNAKANPKPAKFAHNVQLEVLWTIVPILILVVIAIPSMRVLYFLDKTESAEMTVKAIGHQWYWSYEYPDHGDIAFDSYMIPDEEIKSELGQVRLLETDRRVVLPVDTNIRILVTADDVLHSWAVPALGLKMDAVPGRLNETWVRIEKEGVYYGQCSELCGRGHGFMPITIEAVSKEKFNEWVESTREKTADAGGAGKGGADAAQFHTQQLAHAAGE